MKRSCLRVYLILLFLASTCHELVSQDIFRYSEAERIQAFTDRTMYVAGEKILFSAAVINQGDSTMEDVSRIFYCELITSDGKKISGGKYALQNSTGHGCLEIPPETISGVYFLRFYTRLMRNGDAGGYKYIMLKIINPDRTEVLSGNNNDTTDDNRKYGALSMSILAGKRTFSPREEIRLEIKADTVQGHLSGLCLSVIPQFTFKDHQGRYKNRRDTAIREVYMPETRGISLSGQLVEKGSGNPVPDARVNLSVIGDRDILVIRTDSSGRFFFALPDYKGNRDIFLCADEIQDFPTEILIDNDYCSKPVNLPSSSFNMDEDEMNAAYRLVVNAKVNSLFMTGKKEEDTSVEENIASFYGKPTSVLVLDKYIDLPTLEDYFTELPVIVKIRKVKGKKQFRFFTENIEMTTYDPIVLVDWVPVNDIEKILAMSPKEIDRVELVESPYVKGNITFGGIISFISKKNDFAGIDLPKSGTFISYSFLEDCDDEIPSAPSASNIPDARNTVYWNPDVQMDEKGSAAVSFTTPDTPGNYLILLKGMTGSGEEFRNEEMISVIEN